MPRTKRYKPIRDLYEVIDASKHAGPEEIRKKGREAAKRTHPDRGGSAEEFALVRVACEVLGNPECREDYDKTGEVESDSPKDQESAERAKVLDILAARRVCAG